MKLLDLLAIKDFSDRQHLCISVEQTDWRDREFRLLPLDENDDIPDLPDGFNEFLDLWHLGEIIQGIRRREGQCTPERLIHYFEHDA